MGIVKAIYLLIRAFLVPRLILAAPIPSKLPEETN